MRYISFEKDNERDNLTVALVVMSTVVGFGLIEYLLNDHQYIKFAVNFYIFLIPIIYSIGMKTKIEILNMDISITKKQEHDVGVTVLIILFYLLFIVMTEYSLFYAILSIISLYKLLK